MWGIREPLPEAPELVPDVVLAALLAFDLHGYRLGYGGGFYDRTLAAVRARSRWSSSGSPTTSSGSTPCRISIMTSGWTGC